MNKLINKLNTYKIFISLIVFFAVLIRFYFFVGHIFSDDAYYFKLSKLILDNDSLPQYQGYPIFKLRLLFILGNSFMMKFFGIKELSTIILPFTFSILNLFLVYLFAKNLFNDKKVSLIAMLLVAFFPVEIVFASISFPDSINVFLINLGLLLLYNAVSKNNLTFSFLSGFSFSLSLLFKENIIYYLIALSLLWIFAIIKREKSSRLIFVPLLIVVIFFLFEGFIYEIFTGDFLYRYTILEENYKYSFYDFFPYSIEKLTHSDNFFHNLLFQIVLNLKYIFLRRFYLFLPLIALIISVINVFKKENLLVSYFFLMLSFLLISFTTDLTFYRPLNLERSWYIFPLILPASLVAASFLGKFKLKYIRLIFVVYVLGSLIMSTAYLKYFDSEVNSGLKNYLKKSDTHKIYTDHFTKYSIDLLSGNDSTAISFTNQTINKQFILKNSLVIINKKHINELILQGYKFDGLNKLIKNDLLLCNSFGNFNIYQLR